MLDEQEVRDAPGLEELRSALASLESAIHEEYLSPLFNRSPLLVKGAWLHTGTFCRMADTQLWSIKGVKVRCALHTVMATSQEAALVQCSVLNVLSRAALCCW